MPYEVKGIYVSSQEGTLFPFLLHGSVENGGMLERYGGTFVFLTEP